MSSDSKLFNPGWFASDDYTVYRIDEEPQVASSDQDMPIWVHISPSHDHLIYSRAIYNVFDFLGDIGGLASVLQMIAGFIVSVTMSGSLMNRLFSKLFYLLPRAQNVGVWGVGAGTSDDAA